MTYQSNSGYTANSGNSRVGASYGKGGKSPPPKPYDFSGAMKNLLSYRPKIDSKKYGMENFGREPLSYSGRKLNSPLECAPTRHLS